MNSAAFDPTSSRHSIGPARCVGSSAKVVFTYSTILKIEQNTTCEGPLVEEINYFLLSIGPGSGNSLLLACGSPVPCLVPSAHTPQEPRCLELSRPRAISFSCDGENALDLFQLRC
jgi:hypothetical protein